MVENWRECVGAIGAEETGELFWFCGFSFAVVILVLKGISVNIYSKYISFPFDFFFLSFSFPLFSVNNLPDIFQGLS